MVLLMIRIVRITTKDETKMANSQIKKNDKVFVAFGDNEKQQGVVIDIFPGSRWASPSYLVMFKGESVTGPTLTPFPNAGWYDAYRVFRV